MTANGGRINLENSSITSGLVISGLEKTNLILIGGELQDMLVQIDSVSVIEILTPADDVVITQPITLTLNEDTTINVTESGNITGLTVGANAGILLTPESVIPQTILDVLPVFNQTTLRRYPNIQSAIQAAQAGVELLVNSGVFEEDLIINKALRIVGSGLVVIENSAIEIKHDDVTLSGLTALNTHFTRIRQSGISLINLTIQQNTVLDYYVSGVNATGDRAILKFYGGSSGITLTNLSIEGPGQSAVVDSGLSTTIHRPEGVVRADVDYRITGIDLNNVRNVVVNDINLSGVSRYGINISLSSGITLDNISVSNTGEPFTFMSALYFKQLSGVVQLSGVFDLSNNNVGFGLNDLISTDDSFITVDDSYSLLTTTNGIDAVALTGANLDNLVIALGLTHFLNGPFEVIPAGVTAYSRGELTGFSQITN
jgi:hypothetical protein